MKNEIFELTTFGELFEEIEDVKFLIDPIIPVGYITLLAARGGVGKSAYALYLSNKLIQEGKKVLYFDGESTASIFKKRCVDWNLSNWKDILTVRLKDRKIPAGTYCPTLIPKIDSVIEMCNPDLVVIDSLTSLARAKNLNEKKDVSNIFLDLNSVASRNNTAILLLAHTKKKQNQDEFITLDSIAGSGTITDFSRSVLLMENEFNSDIRTITQVKNNISKCAAPFTFMLEETGIGEKETISLSEDTSHKEPEVRSKETKIGRIKRITLDLLQRDIDIKEIRRFLKTEECAFDAEIKTAIDWASKELNISWRK
jgi:predicted ATP-dependent serine protease